MKNKEHVFEDKKTIIKKAVKSFVLMLLCIVMAVIFIKHSEGNEPVGRDRAIAYTGVFLDYERSKNYCGIIFTDGTCHEVYPHTETAEFADAMDALEYGTVLHLLINPDSGYVAEIRTDTRELLNFEESQEAVFTYMKGYRVMGYVVLGMCVLYVIISAIELAVKLRNLSKKGATTQTDAFFLEDEEDELTETPILRTAAHDVKHKVLLSATVENFQIVYRRVKKVNELVINGYVYDEYVALLEFEHTLYARIDGHTIEAGYDDDMHSFIQVDGHMIDRKLRLI